MFGRRGAHWTASAGTRRRRFLTGEGGTAALLVGVDRPRVRLVASDGAVRLGLDDDADGVVVSQVRAHAVRYAHDDLRDLVVLADGGDHLHVNVREVHVAILAVHDVRVGVEVDGVARLRDERGVRADGLDVEEVARGVRRVVLVVARGVGPGAVRRREVEGLLVVAEVEAGAVRAAHDSGGSGLSGGGAGCKLYARAFNHGIRAVSYGIWDCFLY